MFQKFLISATMNSKNVRNGNNCLPLFSRSYHSGMDFFQPLFSTFFFQPHSQVDCSQLSFRVTNILHSNLH